jgi:ABC-type multidrug transport system ATPase subunit
MNSGYRVQNLSVHIGEHYIVDDLSFALSPGEIVALAGASGAGKSMTAMTPFGLSAGVASGSAVLDGVELRSRRKNRFCVPATTDCVDPAPHRKAAFARSRVPSGRHEARPSNDGGNA